MDSSVCLGGQEGGSDLEIRHRIETTKSCMTLLDKYTWRSSVSLDTKIGLYRAYILPVLLCGSETWTITKELCRTVVYWESLLQAVDVAHDVCDDDDSMLTHSGFPVITFTSITVTVCIMNQKRHLSISCCKFVGPQGCQ